MKEFFQKVGSWLKKNFFSIVDRYFMKELLPNYFFGLVFFMSLIILNELFYLARLYFEYNVPFNQVMLLLVYLVPFLLSFAIPFAIIPAYLLTMGRFNSESEIIAMKSCGISAFRIVRSGFIFGILISIFAFFFKDQVEMPSNWAYIQMKGKIMSQKPAVEFKESSFLELGGYKISFESMEAAGTLDVLYGLYVIDIDGRSVIEAEKGRFYVNPENPGHYVLKFLNGSMTELNDIENDDGTTETKTFYIAFDYLALNTFISIPEEFYTKSAEMMSLRELRAEIDTTSEYTRTQISNSRTLISGYEEELIAAETNFNFQIENSNPEMYETFALVYSNKVVELEEKIQNEKENIKNYRGSLPYLNIMFYNSKIAMPMSAFIFALLSLGIGMMMSRRGKGEGLGISIAIMLAYFGMKTGVETMIIRSNLWPYWVWLPNIVFLSIGGYLFIKKVKE